MVDYKTLRVPEPAYEQARDAKRESETWGEFLQRCSETRPEIREFVDASDADTDADGETGTVPDDLREQLDRIEAAASSAEDRAGSIEQTLDRMGGR